MQVPDEPSQDPTAAAFDAYSATGYLHPRYAGSLKEWGQPERLERSGAWLLVRPIPGSELFDALVGYRYLLCHDWSGLAADLEDREHIVSVLGVTEPFAAVSVPDLQRAFPDLVAPYKPSYVVDLRNPSPSRHHRAKARKVLATLTIAVKRDGIRSLDDWEGLYAVLRERHELSGIAAFSRAAFRNQLATPGCITVAAFSDDACIAMIIWYVIGDVAYSHLTASSAEGYRRSAAYAVNQASIELFASQGLRWLDLGSGAGVHADPGDGLSYFKRGWATDTRQTYLCGRIFDAAAYRQLSDERGTVGADFFPAYRAETPGS